MPSISKPAKLIIRVCVFLALVVAILAALSVILTPYDKERDGIAEMYDLPANSINAVFVGASTMRRGISPINLYEKAGIASYNISSSNQTCMGSYYLLKDLLKNQSDISLVVLDAAPLVRDVGYEWDTAVLAYMPMSLNRVEYAYEVSKKYAQESGANFAEELFPLLRFHTRWNELARYHLQQSISNKYVPHSVLGQAFEPFKSNITLGATEKYTTKTNKKITESLNYPEGELESCLVENEAEWMHRTIALCQERNIDVLLIKTPASDWGDYEHDAVTLFAQRQEVEFLDMSLLSIFKECNLSYDSDYFDKKHPNLTGSWKISSYISQYISSNYNMPDAREDSGHDFIKQQQDLYHEYLKDASLWTCADLTTYLENIDSDRYTVFIAVNGEASSALDDKTRAKLEKLGLKKLSNIQQGDSYVGIRDNGAVVKEVTASDGETATIAGLYDTGHLNITRRNMQAGAQLDSPLKLSSTGADETSSGTASIKIDKTERCEDMRGINFVVCQHNTGFEVDSASFDTHVGLARTSDVASSN